MLAWFMAGKKTLIISDGTGAQAHTVAALPYLNCANEKSDASTAALPSRPLMPTPMCAALIMPTSLAPSPMPSVMAPAFFFTMSVICRRPRQHTSQRSCSAEDRARPCVRLAHRDIQA